MKISVQDTVEYIFPVQIAKPFNILLHTFIRNGRGEEGQFFIAFVCRVVPQQMDPVLSLVMTAVHISVNDIDNIAVIVDIHDPYIMAVLVVSEIRQVLRGETVESGHIGGVIVVIPELALLNEADFIAVLTAAVIQLFRIVDTQSDIILGRVIQCLVIIRIHTPVILQQIHSVRGISQFIFFTEVIILYHALPDL